MEAGMKAWLGFTAAGLAAVGMIALPPSGPRPLPWTAEDAREVHARQLRYEVLRLDRVLTFKPSGDY